ncbi:hypothetical protein ACVNPZ_00795 [Staphylococcus aureus]
MKPLLKWSEVPANAVGDAVKRGAINAGLSDAGIISTVVKEAIAWLFKNDKGVFHMLGR